MSYYLRLEGVNLGNFVMDTNDLSTIRGGSLLLLSAITSAKQIIDIQLSCRQDPVDVELDQLDAELQGLKNKEQLTKTEKNKKKNLSKRIKKRKNKKSVAETSYTSETSITEGASWGLFQLDVTADEAIQIKEAVVEGLNQNEELKHATLVVDIHKNNGVQEYKSDRNRLQTVNRWHQMQSPSLAIPTPDKEICDVDKVRPADPFDYQEDEKIHISKSVARRRSYGRANRQQFYPVIPGIDFYTNNLNQISSDETKENLNGKIAFIYIDGNKFGSIQKASQTPKEQRKFDQIVRPGREEILTKILTTISSQRDWIYNDNGKKRIRLETLLWGGDEIIWVVPAWQGWWMLKTFYREAEQLLINPQTNRPLKHAAGLVFCHHNAPIKRIDTMARNLVDGFAKHNRNKNLIAYQVLESFDHAGTDFHGYRKKRLAGTGDLDNLLIDAKDMDKIQDIFHKLKSEEVDFPHRKIYQILQQYRTGNEGKAEEYMAKLLPESSELIEKLKGIFGSGQAHWLHLMDLWDYIPTTGNDNGEVESDA